MFMLILSVWLKIWNGVLIDVMMCFVIFFVGVVFELVLCRMIVNLLFLIWVIRLEEWIYFLNCCVIFWSNLLFILWLYVLFIGLKWLRFKSNR